MHWASAAGQTSVYGEIDFIIVDRQGRALAIEQKNGVVGVGTDDLIKQYPNGAKGVRAQLTRNLNRLRGEFASRHSGQRIDIEHLLYLPDMELAGALPASIDPARVVDARDRERLAARTVEILESAPARSGSTQGNRPADACDIHQFLSDRVDAVPSVDAVSRLAKSHYRRLSGGLATWAMQLELDPHRLRVVGTAGSGKTQLALEELRAARTAGRKALYVCFNRPLANAMRLAAPSPETCMTFHELGAWVMRQSGKAIDWSAPGMFDGIAEAFIEAAPDMRESVDLLIVDEGQDFEASWAQALLQLLRPDGRGFCTAEAGAGGVETGRVDDLRTAVLVFQACSVRTGPVHDAEAVRQCAQPPVQSPQLRARSHQGGSKQHQIHQAAAQPEQTFTLDEVDDLGNAGLPRWL